MKFRPRAVCTILSAATVFVVLIHYAQRKDFSADGRRTTKTLKSATITDAIVVAGTRPSTSTFAAKTPAAAKSGSISITTTSTTTPAVLVLEKLTSKLLCKTAGKRRSKKRRSSSNSSSSNRRSNSSSSRVFADSSLEQGMTNTASKMDAYSSSDMKHRPGYILVLSFREQQTKASDNLFGLQCWAKTLSVNIVEPFVENSHLVVPLSPSQDQLLRYGDIFDIDVRHLLTAKYGFAPLASWGSFVERAPRQLIVVRFKYLTFKMQRKLKDSINVTSTTMNPTPNDDSFKRGCKPPSLELLEKVNHLRTRYNFVVVREVCFNFALGKQLFLHQFNGHLYDNLIPGTVTVLMEEWRGLDCTEEGRRIVLFDACPRSTSAQSVSYTWPSQQLICDAKRYRQKYLQQRGQRTSGYISLMVRTEKVLTVNASRSFMAGCLNETLATWRELQASTGIKDTFLAMDIGKYGSYSLLNRDYKYYPFLDLYKWFLQELFGIHATIESWELGFEVAAQKRDSGYVGSLQKTLAAQSRCIVFTGGGSFQKNTQHIYKKVNHNRRQPCLRVLNKCSRGF